MWLFFVNIGVGDNSIQAFDYWNKIICKFMNFQDSPKDLFVNFRSEIKIFYYKNNVHVYMIEVDF